MSFVRSPLFIHASLWTPLLEFLHVGLDLNLKDVILANKQLPSWDPLPSRTISSGFFPEQMEVFSPEIQNFDHPFYLLPSSQDPEWHYFMVTVAASVFTVITNSYSFVSIRSSRVPVLVISLIICIRKLPLMHSRSLLHCLCHCDFPSSSY